MILTEKDVPALPPPPAYNVQDVELRESRPDASGRRWRTLSSLPSHILLKIIYETLAPVSASRMTTEERMSRTTRVMFWMTVSARLVNRGFYLASMHILRSTFLPAYTRHIKSPYSTDPFPHTSSHRPNSILSLQRETAVLDLFLLLTLRESVCTDDSLLHLSADADSPSSASFRDLFSFMQPRARLEDLVRDFGIGAGLVYTPASSSSKSPSSSNATSSSSSSTSSLSPPYSSSPSRSTLTSPSSSSLPAYASRTHLPLPSQAGPSRSRTYFPPTSLHRYSLPAASLSISLSPRIVGLVVTTSSPHSRSASSKRTIVSTPYDRHEPLERCASRLIKLLKGWCDECALAQ
ncbi:hypothetical protein BD410DRAFT_845230 [Rickenella mellea]|uniref:Uncharacterized protein n=1 Tax=Rickenella mellea TaxID=50990 RepID=A0A4Y7PIT5_9AGAM|nr:hypothetical protein BD410DRAFT_845230 [Rickenella mellea]